MTKIIADLCGNHLHNWDILKAMLTSLNDNGVSIVKTQSFVSKNLKGDYSVDQRLYYKKLELTFEDHLKIKDMCTDLRIELITTCFSIDLIPELLNVGFNIIKVASPDFTSYKMIDKLLENFNEVIVSCAGCTELEFWDTLKRYNNSDALSRIVFMHCNPFYPTELDEVNMIRMLQIKNFGFKYGYSDHTESTDASKLAICLGAEYVEKHFTISKYLPGNDQQMSSTPDQFKELIRWSRKCNTIMGDGCFKPDIRIEKYRKKFIGRWGDNN